MPPSLSLPSLTIVRLCRQTLSTLRILLLFPLQFHCINLDAIFSPD